MKTRQFKRLATTSKGQQEQLVVNGLQFIGANVVDLARELEACSGARAYRASRLLYNIGREEAGKFLVLIDAYRSPSSDQAALSRQFGRAGDHLAKLIYAQIADYSIASQAELLGAVNSHRQELYLDGPNDYDFIYRNDLLSERENALYVDLVDNEGDLNWWPPFAPDLGEHVPRSMRIVQAILRAGLVSMDGLVALRSAWTGFDPHSDSNCWDWTERTTEALRQFPDLNIDGEGLGPEASFLADRWPMPMVELDLSQSRATVEELVAERTARFEAEMRSEQGYGDDY